MECEVQPSAEKDYTTTDFFTTAVLISEGFRVEKISLEGRDGKIKRFHFKDTDKRNQIVMSYVNGELHGNIKKFRHAIDTVKDMLHSTAS